MTVDGQHLPAPCLVLRSGIFARHFLHLRGKLYVIGIIIHNKVVQSQRAGNPSSPLRDFLLNAAVGNIGVDCLVHPLAKPRLQKLGGNRRSDSQRMPLSQGTGCVLYPPLHIPFGMPRRRTAPLPELRQLLRRIFPCQCQHGIQHRRHVSWIKEEPVPPFPLRTLGVIHQKLRKQHVHEVRPPHRPAGMPRLCLFNHCRRQNTNVIRRPFHYLVFIHGIYPVFIC
ncbi:hypothetical protein Barb4_02275 [Bacteroidales bacterium Barb4]|nr:hypothetical protein Barb4_02275 [Bacteroidales bacterium Barb4]